MISREKFISQSLELNLFFLRIMKEHSIFLEAAFTAKDKGLINQASAFKNEFSNLLSNAISLSNGIISPDILAANEIVTKYTLNAERATEAASGISIDSSITNKELSLASGKNNKDIPMIWDQVFMLNNLSIRATTMLIEFKKKLLQDVLSCRTFTNTYPLLIDHILREALLFRKLLTRLQNGAEVDIKSDMLAQETFWNRIMSEHAFFIRGMLDPTEEELFDVANNFGKEFDTLSEESSAMSKEALNLKSLTENTLKETIKIRDFKAQATQGLLNCSIKSIILPLLGDHVLREANHYLNLLTFYSDKDMLNQ